MAKQRNTARETEAVDRKFRLLYNPLIPLIELMQFDKEKGKLLVPVEIDNMVHNINLNWNYQATIFNKKLQGSTANFGAIRTKFQKDVMSRELNLFNQLVAKILEEKYGMKPDKIEVDFILKQKTDGKTPEQVCDINVLAMEAEKHHWYKHKHEWVLASDGHLNFIICKTCRTQFEHVFSGLEFAKLALQNMPKTKLGLLFNKLKNKEIIK